MHTYIIERSILEEENDESSDKVQHHESEEIMRFY